MSNSDNIFDPDYAIPPGETLLETIDNLGLTQKELALRMGRPIKTINEIIKGIASITAETALQLEKVTGVPASFWIAAEANYRVRMARLNDQEAIKEQVGWLQRISYSKMANLDFVPKTSNKEERVNNLLHFFGVASLYQWENSYTELEGAARESNHNQSEYGDLSAWLRAGEIKAQNIECQPYDVSIFHKKLERIKKQTRENPAKIWRKVVQYCAEAGVAVVLIPELPKTHVFGFTRWLTKDKALIQLSLRYKTDDILWFTFFHEAAHIILHGKKDVFIERRGVDNPKEQQANQWAADFLIPPVEWKQFIDRLPTPPTSRMIQNFAGKMGVADSIVLGRLQHREKKVGADQFNSLKHKLEIQWDGLI